ncbi:acyl-CoA dehydrogenase family protein [Erythrobacter sp. Alg231-14]|uniref:acyl-CoA dehydrogenase family protein n=1 Tax=Erythrobacter sp. Alg231-14 TaxID=1922225 RepID=UPI000D54BBC2
MGPDDLTMIADGLERILIDAPLESIDRARGVGAEADALWTTLTEAGFAKLCAAEAHGGFGGSFADAGALAQLTARHACALPLVDTILANGILSATDVEAPTVRIALEDPLNIDAPLAHGGQSDAVLQMRDGRLMLRRLSQATIAPLDNAEDRAAYLVGEPGEVLADAVAPNWLTPDVYQAIGAFSRAAQIAGAMESVLTMTLSYTQEREQFGRPLSKFQAIQHHLSDIACETAASIAAVEMARDAITGDAEFGPAILDEIAIAKVRCGEAASKIAAAAHQAHGAMGFTREYALGRYTRRLWQWQDEFGADVEWATRLGNAVFADANPSLWPRISQTL